MNRFSFERNRKKLECPDCGSTQVETQLIKDRFQYGSGPKAVELEALVPFRKCIDCGFEYTDSEAEDSRHEAICRHLKVMAPAQIIELRRQYSLSRAVF